ncbi:tRNA glutamyl-Q(34) synthetase GluQRS [Scrofimicrobium sp. R131]|uniref:tRNA glutamyl-Q(34) synthetase GluQRS n=1 Tax=Scrofimicrobium appendicitidis TaxID=3079930 RepID=A0AAU7V772_9ACTO
MSEGAGRYAPSPSGPLHIGNLRTALVAWVMARQTGRRFWLRIEDIDPHRTGAADQQIAELASLGLDWDGPVLTQTSRLARYDEVLAELAERDQLFECYCTRREIAEATRAPHTPPHHYPGTCAHLSEAERQERRAQLGDRAPALRLRSPKRDWTVHDEFFGDYSGPVDSFVLRRGDGAPAYNLACVVDDGETGVDQVVRGADLLPTSPGQAYLAQLLGYRTPTYAHVPLVVNSAGQRLAKRDGAVTLEDLGWPTERVLELLTGSLGGPAVTSLAEFRNTFTPADLPLVPYEFGVTTGLRPHRGG